MRKIKRLVTLLAAFALFIIPLGSAAMTVSAEETTTTYYIKYVDSLGEWRYQTGSWNPADVNGSPFYYMYQNIKDGDSVVVDSGNGSQCYVNVPEVQLANVTSMGANIANITAKGVDEVYALFDGTLVINGDVKKAYVYEKSVVNFNNNVDYLEVICDTDTKVHATINVIGTVNHLYAYAHNHNVKFDYYSFKPGTFVMNDGNLNVLNENFSTTAPTTEAAPAPTPSTSTDITTGSEYDDVPKTGENTMPYVMVFSILALCVAGKIALRKAN